MNCDICDAAIPEYSRFCNRCGAKQLGASHMRLKCPVANTNTWHVTTETDPERSDNGFATTNTVIDLGYHHGRLDEIARCLGMSVNTPLKFTPINVHTEHAVSRKGPFQVMIELGVDVNGTKFSALSGAERCAVVRDLLRDTPGRVIGSGVAYGSVVLELE